MGKFIKEFKKEKYSFVQLALTIIFVTCLIISNIIAGKQIQLPFNLVMPGAVIIFPITYILSDIFSEVYGYAWSRATNYMGLIMNLLAVIAFAIAIKIPAPVFYENEEAFKTILGSTPKILIASTLGLWVGDFLNDNVFRLMKKKYKDTHDNYSQRAILSSLVGEIGDSLIFIPIVFYGAMPLDVMIKMMFTQAFLKVGYEVLILPLSRVLMLKVSEYEKNFRM